MSNTPLKSKPSSRWGSLLSGAVANLESRLDTILADETTIASRNAQHQTSASERASRGNDVASSAQSRSSSVRSSSAQPRDKLSSVADSVAQKSGSRGTSQVRGASSLSSSLVADTEAKSRSSLDSTVVDPSQTRTSGEGNDLGADGDNTNGQVNGQTEDDVSRDSVSVSQSTVATNTESISRSDAETAGTQLTVDETSQDEASSIQVESHGFTTEDYEARIAQMKSDHEAAELHRQEESQSNLERIDALQSKLQYLAKEAAESARQAASKEPHDSLEKKLAAKDEQIALLMEEGQQLSKAEVAQSSATRKLRIKAAEDGKAITELKQKLASMERSSTEQAEKIRRLESSQKDAAFRLQRLPRLERDAETLKVSRDEKEATIQALRQQLEVESKRADEAASKANDAALEEERKRNESLQDDLSNARLEKKLIEERGKSELKAAQEELEREQERKKSGELGLRGEISALETRLESLRSQSEEASSGNTNDSQAKLLRQVETLQSQYALARENWQGIETSLQSRVTALEAERAEITRQEAEARKKARESGNNARRLQESLDESSRKCQVLEQDIAQRQAKAEKLESRVIEFENSLRAANDKYEQDRQTWESNLANRIEEEKAKWRQEVSAFPGPDSPMVHDSPTTSFKRSNTLELPGFPPRRPVSRHTSTELSIPVVEKSHSRRSSNRPGRSFDVTSPNGFDSERSTPFFVGNMPETPSIHEMDQDDLVETGSSPHRTVNEMISGSTSAAGPSVQLVERMSAKVRKLETEKAASKDEMARLSGQRDEARKEVVNLMREIDQKRAVDAKVTKMESEIAQIEQRYQTTLEMLGEKSERVEELEADVADLKKIYRELVESTMK